MSNLLEIRIPEGSILVRFADDVALAVTAKTEEGLMIKGKTCVLLIHN